MHMMLPSFRDELEKEAGLKEIKDSVVSKSKKLLQTGKSLVDKAGATYHDAGIKAHIALQGDKPHKQILRVAAKMAEDAIPR